MARSAAAADPDVRRDCRAEMKPFGLYSDIEPVLGRTDVFLAITTYAAEPEPYRDLLHFPDIEPALVPSLARRLHQLELPSGIVPRLTNVGLQEERYFLAFTLGRLSVAPTLSTIRKPVPAYFWEQLREGLKELHGHGLTYGHLREETVAITNRGGPVLFDATALRSVGKQPPDVDTEAFNSLRARLG